MQPILTSETTRLGSGKNRSCADQVVTLHIILEHYGVTKKITSIIQNSDKGLICSAQKLTDVFPEQSSIRLRLSPFLFLLAIDWIMKQSTSTKKWNMMDIPVTIGRPGFCRWFGSSVPHSTIIISFPEHLHQLRFQSPKSQLHCQWMMPNTWMVLPRLPSKMENPWHGTWQSSVTLPTHMLILVHEVLVKLLSLPLQEKWKNTPACHLLICSSWLLLKIWTYLTLLLTTLLKSWAAGFQQWLAILRRRPSCIRVKCKLKIG